MITIVAYIGNPSAPTDLLRELVYDECGMVRKSSATSPKTFETLQHIAGGLGVCVADLFASPKQGGL